VLFVPFITHFSRRLQVYAPRYECPLMFLISGYRCQLCLCLSPTSEKTCSASTPIGKTTRAFSSYIRKYPNWEYVRACHRAMLWQD